MSLTFEAAPILKRLMSATTLRRDVLANNIASQNLPGYRRREVNFEEKLAEALDRGASDKELAGMSPEEENRMRAQYGSEFGHVGTDL